jgi:hypothetical protein
MAAKKQTGRDRKTPEQDRSKNMSTARLYLSEFPPLPNAVKL